MRRPPSGPIVLLSSLLLSLLLAPCHTRADRPIVREFETRRLSDLYFAEGAAFGDLDRDGHQDVVAGPYWHRGPDFTEAREIYPAKPQDRNRYADNFFSFVHDLDGDEWPDVLVVGFPGTPLHWYQNPGANEKTWTRHQVFDWVSNESPTFTQLVGDERPELICTRQGAFGYVTVNWSEPTSPWPFTPISEKVASERFGHGLGVGDVNGDGRLDVLSKDGWYEHPESLAGLWPFHAFTFTPAGGAQMHVLDIDADGDADVVTSLHAHEHGLAWFEQIRVDGEISFRRHLVMGSSARDSAHGVCFSELHALAVADIDGDGLDDLVTGKTYWSHHTQTPSWHDGAVVYWFRLERDESGPQLVPHLVHSDSGIGRQITLGDVDGDGSTDIVTSNMLGTFVHLQRPRIVSQEEYERSRPRRYTSPPEGSWPEGRSPGSAGGEVIALDLETCDLEHWERQGDAFLGQPARGEIDPKRRFGAGKSSGHRGSCWIGGFEISESDEPTGTLLSRAFTLDARFASFLVGGGCHPGVRVELLLADSGRRIFQTHGRQSETMRPEVVDLAGYLGRRIAVRLVDEHSGGFGHLNFDEFRVHDEQPLFTDSIVSLKQATQLHVTNSASLDRSDPDGWVWIDRGEASPADVQHGTLWSASNDRLVGYNVSLPEGYETGEKRYPVVYFLHGAGGTERSDTGIASLAAAGVREGRLEPAIWVFPNGGAYSGYRDRDDGSLRVESLIVRELIPHVDERFRTIARRESRAIAGFSMGGGGSLRIALGQPDLFAAVAAFAPAIGHRGDESKPREDDALLRLDRHAEKIKGRLGLYLVIGSEDRLATRLAPLVDRLRALEVRHTLVQHVGVDHHLGKLLEFSARDALEFLSAHLKVD